MGEGKALRIVEWLREHQDSIELQLGRHVAMPRSKLYAHELQAVVLPATDIRPLEKFIVPAELDGTRGLYRRPQAQCLLKATNDYQAILAWLRSKHGLTPDQKAQLAARRRQRQTGGGVGIEQGLDERFDGLQRSRIGGAVLGFEAGHSVAQHLQGFLGESSLLVQTQQIVPGLGGGAQAQDRLQGHHPH